MKIETKTIVVFEDGDYDLIFSELPNNPCISCYHSKDGSCCGCPDNTKYLEKIKPLKDANVFELATKTNKYYHLNREIEKLKKEMDNIAEEFSELGLNINYIFEVIKED